MLLILGMQVGVAMVFDAGGGAINGLGLSVSEWSELSEDRRDLTLERVRPMNVRDFSRFMMH